MPLLPRPSRYTVTRPSIEFMCGLALGIAVVFMLLLKMTGLTAQFDAEWGERKGIVKRPFTRRPTRGGSHCSQMRSQK